MADADDETCPICARYLPVDTVESFDLTQWVAGSGSSLVQGSWSFCSEEHLAEWLLARLPQVARARVLDEYLPRAPSKAIHQLQRVKRAQVRNGECPFCGSEVIAMHEFGKEGPQRLICCRLIPCCGAQFDLTGAHLGAEEPRDRGGPPQLWAKG